MVFPMVSTIFCVSAKAERKKLKFSTRSKDFLYNEMLELINSFEKEDEVRLLGVYFGDIKKSSLVQLTLNKNL